MPQHYNQNNPDFTDYITQQRQLERLRQTVPSLVKESMDFVDTFYGTKQQGHCRLLPTDELMRRCRQGYTP